MISVMVSSESRENLADFRDWLVDNDYFPTDLGHKTYGGGVHRYTLAVSIANDGVHFGKLANELKRRIGSGMV